MDIEQRITEKVTNLFKDGWFDEQVNEALKEAIKKAVRDQFSYGGDAYKTIREAVANSIVKSIGDADFEYIPKLEVVLKEIIMQTVVGEQKKLLENFQTVMTAKIPEPEKGELYPKITLQEVFKEYKGYISRCFDTYGREVDTDDEPTYVPVACKAWIEERRDSTGYRYNGSFEHADLNLVVDETDDNGDYNFTIPLHRWRGDGESWTIDNFRSYIDFDLTDLAHANNFACYVMRLKNSFVKIENSSRTLEDDVELEAKPECDWS